MSQNRFRRDGRQSYQMNSGGGGGGGYGNRSGQQMNVNPWEGGLVPGGPRSVAGLLPTPPQTSNLLSQLSSTEAQLAIASNLLTTLLRPQQQTPQVPSLLSLGQMGNMNSGSGYRQGYGQGMGRYQDPGPNRRKRMESRRVEPYNKSSQGRRPAPTRGGPDRKPGNQGLRSPSVGKSRSGSKPGGKADKKDDEKDPKKDKDEEDDKNNGAEKKTDEEDVKRDDDEGEKKRDWKDEKKGDDKGDEGGEDDEDDEDDDDENKDKDKDGERVSNSRYSGINPALFYCHVCKKHMWDDTSFQNHLKGRTHQLMMDKLEESYKIKVELLRHELKVAEQQREIELDRMKRQGKKVHMNTREYCTMCDLHFFGNLVVHRKNDRHQHLKNFLHPRCTPCGKEFPTRIEWDHHKLTPLHLRKAAETRKTKKGDDDLAIEDLISPEEINYFAGEEGSIREIEVRTKKDEEDEINEGEKPKDGTDADKAKDDKDGDKDADKGEGSIITTSSGTRFRVPKYNSEVAVGLSLLKKMTGQTCRACHRFFLTEEDANAHCRTRLHYNNFVELVKEKAKAAEAKEKREAKAEAKKKEEKNEKEKLKRKEEGCTVDDEGNWKRRKVANDEDEEEEADAESGEKSDEIKKEVQVKKEEEEEKKKGDGNEKYDPLEADAENSSPEPEPQEPRSEETKGSEGEKPQKEDNIVGDDNLWAEVDRDIGTILDTVDGENENEESMNDLMDDEILNSKDDVDSPSKGGRATSRRSTASAPAKAPAAVRGRGRKKK